MIGLFSLLVIAQESTPVEVADAILPGLGFGWGELLRSSAMLVVGLPLLLFASRWARRTVGSRYSAQRGLIAGKIVFYPGIIVLMISILGELGFGLTPILGAAGVVGIAIGFASQTSVSNIISGLFLIAERPFEVDDVIQVGTTTGRVLSIDTLSIKLRTFDNKFVRIPNETIVKSEVTTLTRFPIRRLDLKVGVAYREDVGRVRGILLDVAAKNPAALMEPSPVVFFEGYGESSVDLRLGVWVVQDKYLGLKNSLPEEVKARFDLEGVEIPFPHRTFFPGLDAGPLQVRLVGEEEGDRMEELRGNGETDPELTGSDEESR
ncbi:MAG: mechanosensitive ion channel family protein [Gemmatimonadota bacterium]